MALKSCMDTGKTSIPPAAHQAARRGRPSLSKSVGGSRRLIPWARNDPSQVRGAHRASRRGRPRVAADAAVNDPRVRFPLKKPAPGGHITVWVTGSARAEEPAGQKKGGPETPADPPSYAIKRKPDYFFFFLAFFLAVFLAFFAIWHSFKKSLEKTEPRLTAQV